MIKKFNKDDPDNQIVTMPILTGMTARNLNSGKIVEIIGADIAQEPFGIALENGEIWSQDEFIENFSPFRY